MYLNMLIQNSLLVSQLLYRLTVLPTPSEKVLQTITDKFLKYIWSHKPPRIAYNTLVGSIEMGGVRLVHISYKVKALKCAWVKRLICSKSSWKDLAYYNFKFKDDLIWRCIGVI